MKRYPERPIWGIRTAGTKFAVRETTSIASQILSM